MASGKLYAGILPADTDTDTGATPPGRVHTVSVNAVNLGASATTLKVYIGSSVTPTAADRIEPDISLSAGSGYERTGLIVGAGERLLLNPGTGANVSARVTCFEEAE